MKRPARKLALVLLLLLLLVGGAIINIAVAWLCISDSKSARAVERWVAKEGWVAVRVDDWDNERLHLFYDGLQQGGHPPVTGRFEDVMTSWASEVFPAAEQENSTGEVTHCHALASGFPCIAMWGASIDKTRALLGQGGPLTLERCLVGAISPPKMKLSQQFLPLRPIWPGLAINTVLYAVTVLPFVAALFALRRSARRRRGLCPACAYPVGDSPVCTECGKALSSGKDDGM